MLNIFIPSFCQYFCCYLYLLEISYSSKQLFALGDLDLEQVLGRQRYFHNLVIVILKLKKNGYVKKIKVLKIHCHITKCSKI